MTSAKHTARTACGNRDCCVVTVDPELRPPWAAIWARPMFQVMTDDGSLILADNWDSEGSVLAGNAMRTTVDDYAAPGRILL